MARRPSRQPIFLPSSGEVEIGGHVAQQGEQAIAQAVPEIHHPVGGGALEAAAEDHIGAALHNRADHQGVFGWVDFEICILHDADLVRRP
ncbi:MAG: hypothetical protein HQ469_07540 [Cyanobacteria bacterium]|nr:hypothetical protein [Cyanobacteria bacterium bin.275]